MNSDNTRHVARVPIVPDDFVNQDSHKDHELVMDFNEDDIYVKKGNGYINITGKIKEDIKQIQDGSAVIHVVTDQTVPPIKDRSENNWYYIIESAEEIGGSRIPVSSYIYYGLIKSYERDKNYILIAQNSTSHSGSVKFEILEGYCPCLYIPISYGASFTDHNTGKPIEHVVEDRIYAMNPSTRTFIVYDVYTLKVYDPGTHVIDIDLTGSDHNAVQFDVNTDEPIKNLTLPGTMNVREGSCIGTIDDPTWEDPRFIFYGWSTDKIAKTIIDPAKYKPVENMTLYAWFERNDDPTMIEYFATYTT